MLNSRSYLIFLAMTVTVISLGAQRFSMGVGVAGIMSQIDGDDFEGYDKFGLRIGVRGEAYISRRLDFAIEMNIEEKGSRFEDDPAIESKHKGRVIALSYAEMPLMLRYSLRRRPGPYIEGGVAISYLLNSTFGVEPERVSLEEFEMLSPNFSRSEWNILLGGGFAINQHLDFYFRTSIGFSHLYRDLEVRDAFERGQTPGVGESSIYQLRNYLISLGAHYML
ncbi:MAG: PorT family protein [Saprospiraceae bacterium]|nr:PorT family protein [Saprospiraceae bacterium]